MKKNIAFVIVLLLIVGGVWYLESAKAHPSAGAGASGAPQAINIGTAGGVNIGTSTGVIAMAVNASGTASSASVSAALATLAAQDRAAGYQPAIEIADPTGFINASSSFALKSLIGKQVILLDFWTYSCINCIRTIPYLDAWYSRYHADGLQIVGIHTPEFEFEKNIANVQAAVIKYGIQYPVVLDSNMGTWNAYGNLYWPHEYLIDMAGYIVHDQIGEGNYGETETEIQKLLAQRDKILGLPLSGVPGVAAMPTSTVFVASSTIAAGDISPETYFGSNRNEYLGNGNQGVPGVQSFTAPPAAASGVANISADTLYLGGSWDIEPEFAQSTGADTIYYHYDAEGVYFVAGSADGSPIDVEVLRDGQPIPASAAGSDIFYKNGHSYVEITGDRLYRIIDDTASGDHLLEFIISSPSLQAYTFTFG